MNDPNGLVYHNGEYHLFYQYNPFGIRWGHMSWGHAVSTDLVHWEHLPVALFEEDGVMIFSGSAVVDHQNTSGFGSTANPPLVAIYTGHTETNQSQHIAYSLDDGRTWTKYEGNPVIDLGMKDFRDPKVIWHDETDQWIMTVTLPVDRQVAFFASSNLIDWEETGRFGPAGSIGGIWECPDLFRLPVENSPGEYRWVLYQNLGSESVAGGSGAQYFVGTFDGSTFIPEHPNSDILWADYGKDFYAAVTYSDIPEQDGRRILHGWVNNWEYAQDIPTDPWRSAQSIPRALSLRQTAEGIRLVQRPVEELTTLRRNQLSLKNLPLAAVNEQGLSGNQVELKVAFDLPESGFVEIELLKSQDQQTTLRFDIDRQELQMDRTGSGHVDFHEAFPAVTVAPLSTSDNRLDLHIFIDQSIIEVFAEDGLLAMTNQVFPSEEALAIQFKASSDDIRVAQLDFWRLKSAWR